MSAVAKNDIEIIKALREKFNNLKFGDNINYDQGFNDALNQVQEEIEKAQDLINQTKI